jgi:putative endonuclease
LKNKKIYIGYCSDLRKRLQSHLKSKNKYTKGNLPYELIYYEAYKSEKDARQRELSLKKQGRQKAFLKSNLKNSLLD